MTRHVHKGIGEEPQPPSPGSPPQVHEVRTYVHERPYQPSTRATAPLTDVGRSTLRFVPAVLRIGMVLNRSSRMPEKLLNLHSGIPNYPTE